MATKKETWNDSTQLETDLAWNANSLSAVQTAAGKFDIFDTKAREGVIDNRARIDDIKDIIAGGVNFRGKTTEDCIARAEELMAQLDTFIAARAELTEIISDSFGSSRLAISDLL